MTFDPLQQTITDDDAQRQIEIANRWLAYDGTGDDSLVLVPGQPNDNVHITNAQTIVDTGVDFLFGNEQELVFNVASEDDGAPPSDGLGDDTSDTGGTQTSDSDDDASAASDRLEEVWDDNDKQVLLAETGMNGAVAGHAAIKFVPAKPGGEHRLISIDPATHTVECDPHDYKRVLTHRLQYNNGTDATGKPIVFREDHVRGVLGDGSDAGYWTITRYTGQATALRYTTAGLERVVVRWEQVGEPEHWGFTWSQIHDCQNLINPNVYWGRSDIEPALMHVNGVVDEVASDTKKTLRYFAHPTPWTSSPNPTQTRKLIDASIGATLCLPEGSTFGYAEMASDLLASAAFLQTMDDKQFELARIPKIARGVLDNLGQLSSLALEIMYRPLIAKTRMKRNLYGGMLRRLCQHILEFDGFGAKLDVDLQWPDVLPKNMSEQASTAGDLQSAGVSQHTILTGMGYDPEVEARKRAEEAADPMNDSFGMSQDVGQLNDRVASVENQMNAGAASSAGDDAGSLDVGAA